MLHEPEEKQEARQSLRWIMAAVWAWAVLIAGGVGAGVYGKTNNGLRALVATLIVLAICGTFVGGWLLLVRRKQRSRD